MKYSTPQLNSEAHVFIFDIFGKQLQQFPFPEEVKSAGILKVKHWETGIAVLTKDFNVWVISDLEFIDCQQLAALPSRYNINVNIYETLFII